MCSCLSFASLPLFLTSLEKLGQTGLRWLQSARSLDYDFREVVALSRGRRRFIRLHYDHSGLSHVLRFCSFLLWSQSLSFTLPTIFSFATKLMPSLHVSYLHVFRSRRARFQMTYPSRSYAPPKGDPLAGAALERGT